MRNDVFYVHPFIFFFKQDITNIVVKVNFKSQILYSKVIHFHILKKTKTSENPTFA